MSDQSGIQRDWVNLAWTWILGNFWAWFVQKTYVKTRFRVPLGEPIMSILIQVFRISLLLTSSSQFGGYPNFLWEWWGRFCMPQRLYFNSVNLSIFFTHYFFIAPILIKNKQPTSIQTFHCRMKFCLCSISAWNNRRSTVTVRHEFMCDRQDSCPVGHNDRQPFKFQWYSENS